MEFTKENVSPVRSEDKRGKKTSAEGDPNDLVLYRSPLMCANLQIVIINGHVRTITRFLANMNGGVYSTFVELNIKLRTFIVDAF